MAAEAAAASDANANAAASPIVLRAPEGEEGWMMVDIQGSLETRNGQTLDGVEIGTLIREEGIPKLVMGKTCLEGTEVKLKKALAIMELIKTEGGGAEYHLKGVARSKIVFKSRPVPINRSAALDAPTNVGSKRTRADELDATVADVPAATAIAQA